MYSSSGTLWVRIVLLAASLAACDKPEATGGNASTSASAPASATAASPRFDLYDAFAPNARLTDPLALPSGDVALAKGRRVAPIELHVQRQWSAEDRAEIDRSSEIRRLTDALGKARAPFCAGAWESCLRKTWYADDPKSAGIVLYVDRKTDAAGTYHFAGSDTALATGYETVLTFTAVLVPENVRVARWAQFCAAPAKSTAIQGKVLMQSGMLSPSAYDEDMKTLTSGVAPKGNFSVDAVDTTLDAGAPAKRSNRR